MYYASRMGEFNTLLFHSFSLTKLTYLSIILCVSQNIQQTISGL